jgi:hypothetical protein
MPISFKAFGVLPPLWSSAAMKPGRDWIALSCWALDLDVLRFEIRVMQVDSTKTKGPLVLLPASASGINWEYEGFELAFAKSRLDNPCFGGRRCR